MTPGIKFDGTDVKTERSPKVPLNLQFELVSPNRTLV